MPNEGQALFKTQEQIAGELKTGIRSRVSDAYIGEDGNMSLLFETFAGSMESVFLAIAIMSEDMFVQTANGGALERHGLQYGVPKKVGTFAQGNLLVFGAGGTVVPQGSQFAFDPQTGEALLYFISEASASIPNPGVPTVPTLTDLAVAGNLNGSFEYVIVFKTADGETAPGAESALMAVVNSKIRLTNIPLGGPGTTARKIFRQKNGSGDYNLVATINDNTTVTYDDNIADGSLGGAPLDNSTAEQISILAQAEDAGAKYNLLPGTITVVSNAAQGVTDVTNPAAFTGGSDPEETEPYRTRLLQAVRNPGTGSPGDLKTWAEQIEGVETATVFPNDNLGTPTNGHVTIRIAGPGGAIPDSAVQTAVYDSIAEQDLANITIHVATFTAVSTAVSVTLTMQTGFVVADVSESVQTAISDYINSLLVGETLRIAGIVDAVFGLPGVADVTVTTPGSNQATGATSKRTPGTITVS